MNACKELEGFNMVKSQISELDRLIFILTNKRGKAKALKAAQALPWSYIEGMKESNRINTIGYLENGLYDLEKRNVVVYNEDSVVTTESEAMRFKIQNSFDWTLKELFSGTFPVRDYPTHTRKNIKRIESMYKYHHGVKLDWQLAAAHFPEFFPGTKTAPKRPKGALYKHSKGCQFWVGEDMIVLPMLFKLKILRDEAMGFLLDFKMKLSFNRINRSLEKVADAVCISDPQELESFLDGHDFKPLVIDEDLALMANSNRESEIPKRVLQISASSPYRQQLGTRDNSSFQEKIEAQGGAIPELFYPTLVIGEDGKPVEPVDLEPRVLKTVITETMSISRGTDVETP